MRYQNQYKPEPYIQEPDMYSMPLQPTASVMVPPPFKHNFAQPIKNTKSSINDGNREILERAKINLAVRQDFNLIDAFRIFDEDGNGSISANQIVYGLNKIGCFVQQSDVCAFLKIFDRNQTGSLKYSEFCDAFLPLDN